VLLARGDLAHAGQTLDLLGGQHGVLVAVAQRAR
jgi:hypothetical protein